MFQHILRVHSKCLHFCKSSKTYYVIFYILIYEEIFRIMCNVHYDLNFTFLSKCCLHLIFQAQLPHKSWKEDINFESDDMHTITAVSEIGLTWGYVDQVVPSKYWHRGTLSLFPVHTKERKADWWSNSPLLFSYSTNSTICPLHPIQPLYHFFLLFSWLHIFNFFIKEAKGKRSHMWECFKENTIVKILATSMTKPPLITRIFTPSL